MALTIPQEWAEDIAADTARGRKRAAAWDILLRQRSRPRRISTVGNRIKSALEAAMQTTITCGACANYLFSLNNLSDDKIDWLKIATELAESLIIPSWIRDACGIHDRSAEITYIGDVVKATLGITEQDSRTSLKPFESLLTERCDENHADILSELAHGEYAFPVRPISWRGDGILYVGGGSYWPGIVLGIRMLRDTGSTLPVEIWHRGSMEPVKPEQVADLGDVTIIDTVAHRDGQLIGGWEQKLYAMYHTTLERILYLDSDAYVTEDPSPLFERMTTGSPFQFWEDLPGNRRTVKWHEVWRSGPGTLPPIQGGQLLIDIGRAWKLICIAHWMNFNSHHYYRYMYGDQDTWRVALAAIADRSMWCRIGAAPWKSPAFVIPQGIVHRCRGKLVEFRNVGDNPNHSETAPNYDLPRESRVFSHLASILSDDPETVFPTIYEKRIWGKEDLSGAGSSNKESKPWIDFVNARHYQSAVDIGCGSGTVAKQLDIPQYTGFDVAPEIIRNLQSEQPSRTWVCCDLLASLDLIPNADVLLCKDVLHHWPTRMIKPLLQWIKDNRHKWKDVLICCDRHQVENGSDCPLGSYRALNSTMDPLKEFGLKNELEYLHKAIYSM